MNGTNKVIRANETSCRSHAILHVCFAPSPCRCGILMQIVGSTVAPRLLRVPLWHYKFHTGLRRGTQSRPVFPDYRGLGPIVSWIFEGKNLNIWQIFSNHNPNLWKPATKTVHCNLEFENTNIYPHKYLKKKKNCIELMRLVVSCKLLDCCGMRVVNTAQKISTMVFFRRDHLSPLTYNTNSPKNVVIIRTGY